MKSFLLLFLNAPLGFRYKHSVLWQISGLVLLFLLNSTSIHAQLFECLTETSTGHSSNNCPCGPFDDPNPYTCPLLDTPQEELPEITIYVNLHFINSENGNFYPGENDDWSTLNGNNYAKQMLIEANKVLNNIAPSQTSLAHYIGDARYHYEWYIDPSDPDNPNPGIYFWDTIPATYPHEGYVMNIIMDNEILNPNDEKRDELSEISAIRGYTYFELDYVVLLNAYNTVHYGFHSAGFWNYGRLINHEVGHVVGLCHSYDCYDYCQGIDLTGSECVADSCSSGSCGNSTPDWCKPQISGSSNIMGYNDVNSAFTPCQWKKVYGYFMNVQPDYVDIDACDPIGEDIVIEAGTNEVWDHLKFINNRVIVETGASLRITCEVRMAEKASFYVKRGAKLTVDGGRITNWCPGTRWRGIRIWGNTHKAQPDPDGPLADDDAGVVKIINNAIIDHAQIAIGTFAKGYNPLAYNDYYGAVVIAENSSFINNRKAVAFMQYPARGSALPSTNKSKFINCDFREDDDDFATNTIGVTIWDCDGITFQRNRFRNMDMSGILGIDFGAIITDANDFTGCNMGIESYSSYPFSSSIKIGEVGLDANYFTNNNIHILSEASKFGDGLEIQNNEFFTADYGIWIEGNSLYDIERNSFYDERAAIVCHNTGDQGNLITCNEISDNTDYGIGIMGTNGSNLGGLQFRGNDFNTDATDIYIGEADGITGSPRLHVSRANNCFTSGTPDILADENGTELFNYYCDYIENTEPCFEPLENLTNGGGNNYEMVEWKGNSCPKGIGPGFSEPPYEKTDYIIVKKDIAEKEMAYSQNSQDVALLQKLLDLYEHKDRVYSYLVGTFVRNKDWVAAESLVQQEGSSQMQRHLYALKIMAGDLAAAQEVLNTLVENQKDQDFKRVQEINIQRMQSGPDFVLSTTQENLLQEIANSSSTERNYARSLLVLLQDVRFEYTFLGEMANTARSKQKEDWKMDQDQIQLYPNPAKKELTINIPMGYTSVEIIDLAGSLRYSNQVDVQAASQLQVFLSDWSPGLYMVRFYKADGQMENRKIVVVK